MLDKFLDMLMAVYDEEQQLKLLKEMYFSELCDKETLVYSLKYLGHDLKLIESLGGATKGNRKTKTPRPR